MAALWRHGPPAARHRLTRASYSNASQCSDLQTFAAVLYATSFRCQYRIALIWLRLR